MYLSRLILNPRSRQVQSELYNPYEMHRTIMKGYPEQKLPSERVLYRLETKRSPATLMFLLIQSIQEPNWRFLDGKDYLLSPPEVKTFDPVFVNGQVFNFRLLANPTKKLRQGDKEDSKRVGLYRLEEQECWMIKKAKQHGFCILAMQITPSERWTGKLIKDEKTHHLRLLSVQYEGYLEVIDADRFTQAVKYGIGSGKGFGFGLLSLAAA